MSGYWVAAYLVLWGAVLLAIALTLGLLRRVAAVLPEVEHRLRTTVPRSPIQEGLPPGSKAPTFEAIAADGSRVRGQSLAGMPRVVLVMDEGCLPASN